MKGFIHIRKIHDIIGKFLKCIIKKWICSTRKEPYAKSRLICVQYFLSLKIIIEYSTVDDIIFFRNGIKPNDNVTATVRNDRICIAHRDSILSGNSAPKTGRSEEHTSELQSR